MYNLQNNVFLLRSILEGLERKLEVLNNTQNNKENINNLSTVRDVKVGNTGFSKKKRTLSKSSKVHIFKSFHPIIYHRRLRKHEVEFRVFNCYAYVQGVQEKNCFFTIHCNPSLAFIAVRDLRSSHCKASVQY